MGNSTTIPTGDFDAEVHRGDFVHSCYLGLLPPEEGHLPPPRTHPRGGQGHPAGATSARESRPGHSGRACPGGHGGADRPRHAEHPGSRREAGAPAPG